MTFAVCYLQDLRCQLVNLSGLRFRILTGQNQLHHHPLLRGSTPLPGRVALPPVPALQPGPRAWTEERSRPRDKRPPHGSVQTWATKRSASESLGAFSHACSALACHLPLHRSATVGTALPAGGALRCPHAPSTPGPTPLSALGLCKQKNVNLSMTLGKEM